MKKSILVTLVLGITIVGLMSLFGCKKIEPSGELNGHGYVDLGLPSGTLWATCNIGADNAEDEGEYYAWGEARTKGSYDWSNYKYGYEYYLTKYCSDSFYGDNGFIDNLTRLVPSDDVATIKWGNGWRIPSPNEMQELLSECSWKEERFNGVKGILFTGPNGSTLFLRDDHMYWSNECEVSDPSYAYALYPAALEIGGWWRCEGFYVRPVTSGR